MTAWHALHLGRCFSKAVVQAFCLANRLHGFGSGLAIRAFSYGPFSVPCASRACDLARWLCSTDDEAFLDTAHPCPNCPRRLRQTCAREDSAVWAAPLRRRKIDTSELLKREPISPGFR